MIAGSATCLAAASVTCAQEPARSADDFVDRIGVCTHWAFSDTPYGLAYPRVKQLLAESGIRHVRDSFHRREAELFTEFGIKTTMIFSPSDPLVAVGIVRDNASLIDMVEGPNEVDQFATSARYARHVFPEGPRLFQEALYAALKTDPITARFGVIAPSTVHASANRELLPLTGFDYLVMHSYAGGQMPSSSLEGDVNNNILKAYDLIAAGGILKPIVVTESGYHTALGSSVVIGGAQPGVTEKTQSKYLLRHFATYFNAGIVRTFTYEFLDEFADYDKDERQATNAEACFGILKRDLTPKPAYTALKNLITLLSERRWDPTAQQWEMPDDTVHDRRKRVAVSRVPGALDFTLSSASKSVRHTLLQKTNGDFYLLVWQEVSSFDTETHTDIANADVPATLDLRTPIRSAAIYRPSTGTTAQESFAATRRITLSVPDEIVVVRLSPTGTVAGRIAPPGVIQATTTGSTAHLTWTPPAGPQPAGYFVTRIGAFVGRTILPTFDDTKLRPGAGYTYTVSAYDRAGHVSDPTSGIARTRDEYPDLTITNVTMNPPHPNAGDSVTFTATVKNIGQAPTPVGVTLGVSFSVDGVFASWSDRFAGPLAPGESRDLAANYGPKGTALWKWTGGAHTVRAVADDVNRIAERDKTNNVLEKSLP